MEGLEMCERRKKKPGVKEWSQGKKMKKMKKMKRDEETKRCKWERTG
jgi:hypothetical protein